MRKNRPRVFRGRHFEDEIILLCVRWYLRYALSFRDLEELMAERSLSVDHSTIWRWVQRYAPELNRRCRRELRKTNRSWRVDETYLRVAGKGRICIGRLTPRAPRSIFYSPREEMRLPRSYSSQKHCAMLATHDQG